jgi:hypothetical protein
MRLDQVLVTEPDAREPRLVDEQASLLEHRDLERERMR